MLAAARWAQAAQAADQVAIARISRDETRRQIALAASDAYLAVINLHRQVTVQTRALENGRAHLSFATARLQAGAGSRLNELRAAQETSTDEVLLEAALLGLRRAQEALGVILVVDGPVDAVAEPVFELPGELPSTWLSGRVDVRLADAEVSAAERVRRDSWKDWVPTGIAVVPAAVHHPVRALPAVELLGRGRAVRHPDLRRRPAPGRGDAARRRPRAGAHRSHSTSSGEIRADERIAREAVVSTARALAAARRAADQANEVVRITDVAFRAGATTNLEVIDAQRRARDTETAAAIAEDRARQARLDLLVALGLFPR